jgi:hypothetical protein
MNSLLRFIAWLMRATKIIFGFVIPIGLIIAIVIGIGYLGYSVWGFMGVIAMYAVAVLIGYPLAKASYPHTNYWQTWWLINRDR